MSVRALPKYTARHSASISGTVFLIEVRNAATRVLVVLSAWVNAETDETTVQLPFRIAHWDTQGATGTSLTIDAHQAGFATSACTAVYNPGTAPTTQLDTLAYEGASIIGPGFQWDGEGRDKTIAPSNSVALELMAAPPGAVTLDFGLEWGEIG